jgi:hypothetical protein
VPEERIPKLIMEWIPRERRKRTPKEDVGGRSASSHDNKKFRTRLMEKEREMVFCFRNTATVVKNTAYIDIYIYIYIYRVNTETLLYFK